MIREPPEGNSTPGVLQNIMSERSDLDRLIDLESRQAYQDETIASLNLSLVSQQQRIDQLEKMLELVAERLGQSEPDIDLPADEPPPPHY